ncbi:hypothetical protein AB0H83_44895 [Dactylosporangium sp. NPDC050688]|uniref:hypothetical protein n=1 Tax=Dactylosporangium sp. NPDC050688 TaxID=3157217 RepID=UPI0033E58FE3
MAPIVSCAVTYQVERVGRDGFDAAVTVGHGGDVIPGASALSFAFPGGQAIVASAGGWRQSGNDVVATVDGAWAAQSPTTLRFPAGYQGQNPPPPAFYLGDSACQTTVVTPPAAVPSNTGDDGSDDDGNSGSGNNNGNGNGNGRNRGRGNSQAE